MTLKIKKRCIRCLKVLREDGTCPNVKCVRYKPEEVLTQEMSSEDTATDSQPSDDYVPSTSGYK